MGLIFCVSFIFMMYGNVFGYQNDSDIDLNPSGTSALGWFYFSWASCIAAFALGLLLYTIISAIKYFRHPNIVMTTFSKQIQGDTGEDFIIWWQFRRYYIENDVRLTENVLNVFLRGNCPN